MNNSTLPIKAFLAVLVAIICLPFGGAAAATAFTLTGILSVFLADYGRNLEPVRASAEMLPFGAAPRAEALRRAA
jgi:hypothetical protein